MSFVMKMKGAIEMYQDTNTIRRAALNGVWAVPSASFHRYLGRHERRWRRPRLAQGARPRLDDGVCRDWLALRVWEDDGGPADLSAGASSRAGA
jgi:hypothetical protein